MALLIDGYNLMHAAGIMGRGVGPGSLERSRLALLNFVVESVAPAEHAATIVVFDARSAPPGLPRELSYRGIRVQFAVDYEDADELIEELIEHDSAPKRLVVVSSDHRLHRAARRRKAQAIDSDVWFRQTLTERESRRRGRDVAVLKPVAPPTAGEVEFWLSQFGDEPLLDELDTRTESPRTASKRSQPRDDEPIFPQEYLDSIDEQDDA